MNRALLWIMCVGTMPHPGSAQTREIRHVESARIGRDHRVYVQWSGGAERIQAAGEEQAATDDLKIAPNRAAVGWLVERSDLSDANYPEPFELLVAWNGGAARSIFPGRVISRWQFEDDGRRVALYQNTGHGDQAGCAMLYDARTAKRIATWCPDEKKAPKNP